jgi:hypothetical protein
VEQEVKSAPHTGRSFLNDMRKVWEFISNICVKHSCFVYITPALRTRNGRDAYMLLFDHFLGPKMWGIWPVQQRPISLGPSRTEKRNVSPEKHMSGSILNNIQSSMD